jgi:hypothetical protein
MSETTTAPSVEGEDRTWAQAGDGTQVAPALHRLRHPRVYAVTGDVAADVGGAAWAPFVAAFAVAIVMMGRVRLGLMGVVDGCLGGKCGPSAKPAWCRTAVLRAGPAWVPMAVVHREEEWAHRPDKPCTA